MLTARRLSTAALLGLSAALVAGCETGQPSNPTAGATTKPVAAAADCGDCCEAKTVSAPAAATQPSAAPTTGPTTAPSVAATTQPAAAATQPAAAEGGWRDMLDAKTFKDAWRTSEFAGHGEVELKDGVLQLPSGEGLTGVTYVGKDLPKADYEVEVVAKRIDGVDFFCGLTFPVNDTHATLVVGGWGGTVVGISSIDNEDAAHNDTTKYKSFKLDRYYTVRLRVQAERIQAWIDDEQLVDANIKGKKVSVRGDIDEGKPLGVAAWQTSAAVKSIRIRKI